MKFIRQQTLARQRMIGTWCNLGSSLTAVDLKQPTDDGIEMIDSMRAGAVGIRATN